MDLKYSGVGSEPLTASEVKNYLKIDFTTDDALISDLITGMREHAEQLTGRSLVVKTIELFEEDYDQIIRLPYPDHNSVTAITINGDDQLNDSIISGNYEKVIKLPKVYDRLTEDDAGVKITYTTLGTCPEGIKLAILKGIGEVYERRGNTFEGAIAQLPENSISMLTRFMRL